MDIKKVKTANACCIRGPLICFAMKLPSSIPATAPAVNGMPIDQFRWPAIAAVVTPVIEIKAKTPSDVATIDCMGRSVTFLSAGTMMKPPPTPSSPDKNPATAPEPIRERAHGTDQIRRPID